MFIHANTHIAMLGNLFVFVYAGIQSALLDFCLATAVPSVTQISEAINCSTYCFVWHKLHSSNIVLLSAYTHIRFHISKTCAIYEGSGRQRNFFILSTHCTAMHKGQASEPVSKKDCLVNLNQISELVMDSDSNESLGNVVATAGWEILWSSFTGTTTMIAGQVYSAFQCSGNTQPRFS